MKLRSLYHKAELRPVSMIIVGLTWFYALFYGKGKALKYNYDHEELWKPDEELLRLSKEDSWSKEPPDVGFKRAGITPFHFKYAGECFSSTTRGDAKGVRIAPASKVLHNPGRWEYIEFEVDDELFNMTWPGFEKMATKGLKYDFKGVLLGFASPYNIQNPVKWYCSEICVFAKCIWRVMKRWPRISPRRSAFEMAKKYHEPISLLEKP